MEGTSLLVFGLVFGSIGLAFFVYGKKQQAVVPLCAGVALMAIPYFVPNPYVLAAAGVALIALPYFVRW
ncbi:MAG: hypothetical protein ACC662_05215 [Planctomycetota bacterium]